jgi:hypothetical protein
VPTPESRKKFIVLFGFEPSDPESALRPVEQDVIEREICEARMEIRRCLDRLENLLARVREATGEARATWQNRARTQERRVAEAGARHRELVELARAEGYRPPVYR